MNRGRAGSRPTTLANAMQHSDDPFLHLGLEHGLPASLEVGRGNALVVRGWCFHRRLELTVLALRIGDYEHRIRTPLDAPSRHRAKPRRSHRPVGPFDAKRLLDDRPDLSRARGIAPGRADRHARQRRRFEQADRRDRAAARPTAPTTRSPRPRPGPRRRAPRRDLHGDRRPPPRPLSPPDRVVARTDATELGLHPGRRFRARGVRGAEVGDRRRPRFRLFGAERRLGRYRNLERCLSLVAGGRAARRDQRPGGPLVPGAARAPAALARARGRPRLQRHADRRSGSGGRSRRPTGPGVAPITRA